MQQRGDVPDRAWMRARLLLTCVQKLSQSTIYILFVPIRLNLYARIRGGGTPIEE